MNRKDRSFIIHSENYGRAASLPRYYTRERLHVRPLFSCTAALENRELEWSGGVACDEDLELSDEVSRLGKFCDVLVHSLHLRRRNGLVA